MPESPNICHTPLVVHNPGFAHKDIHLAGSLGIVRPAAAVHKRCHTPPVELAGTEAHILVDTQWEKH